MSNANATAFGSVIGPIMANIVNPLIELAFAVALLVFVYGVLKMVMYPIDAEEHAKGKRSLLTGIIGMFIMFSAWGIINLIANTVKQF